MHGIQSALRGHKKKCSFNNCECDGVRIPCQVDGKFAYRTIEELSLGDWEPVNDEQEVSTPIPGILVWSDKGFTKPKYVMRHPQEGTLTRVLTHAGLVDCTKDHSLLSPDGTQVTPSELNIGDSLMHFSYPLPQDTPAIPLYDTISDKIIADHVLHSRAEEIAFVHGLFFAEGTCGTWDSLGNAKSSWIIYNQDLHLLERAHDILIRDGMFSISPYYESGEIYHLRGNGEVRKLCDEYRELFYDERRYKKVPDYVLHAALAIRQAFFIGYYAGDGNRHVTKGVIVSNRGQRGTAGLMYLANSIGYKVSINNDQNEDLYRLQCCTKFRNQHVAER